MKPGSVPPPRLWHISSSVWFSVAIPVEMAIPVVIAIHGFFQFCDGGHFNLLVRPRHAQNLADFLLVVGFAAIESQPKTDDLRVCLAARSGSSFRTYARTRSTRYLALVSSGSSLMPG